MLCVGDHEYDTRGRRFGSFHSLTAAAFAALAAAALIGNAQSDPVRVDCARSNYKALVSGHRQLSQLTPEELVDIIDFQKALRQEPDPRPPSQRHIDEEIARAGGNPSHLERQVIDLKCRSWANHCNPVRKHGLRVQHNLLNALRLCGAVEGLPA